MATIVLPFSMENKADSHDMGILYSDLSQKLTPQLKQATEDAPHVFEYLQMLSASGVVMPHYCAELSKKMADDKAPNYLYPVGHNGTFAHILADARESRHNYISVEPTSTLNIDSLMRQAEDRCIEFGDMFHDSGANGDKKQQLLEYIDQITTVVDQPTSAPPEKSKGFLHRGYKKLPRIQVTQRELEGIRYLFLRDKVGMGIIEPLMNDPYIEDVSCSGLGHVFVEHKIFKSLKSIITFSNLDELDEFVLRLAERIRKPVTYRNPIADAILPDGSRINIVYGRDVSKRGSNFSIRKFKEVPISIFELVDFGSIDYNMLAYMSLIINNGMNVFVSGESASGKTTMLNALTTFLSPLAKVVSIEDTPELRVPHKNWVREVVQTTKSDDTSGQITMFDLLKAALRQRPNEIVVGEIRGREGNIAFQAMQTGHSVMATFHAANVERLIQRITNDPISVPKTYIDNLNVLVFMSTVKLPTGKMGRRVTSICEIVSYDPIEKSFNIMEAFHWDEATDTYDFTGYMTSHILERKIAPKMGIAGHNKRRIYAEVERRAKILEKLHKEQKITGFYEVLKVINKAQQEGHF